MIYKGGNMFNLVPGIILGAIAWDNTPRAIKQKIKRRLRATWKRVRE